MSQPTGNLPDWDTSNTNVTEPTSGQKASGWATNQAPPSSYMNWWMRTVGLWIAYLYNIAGEVFIWTAAHTFQKGIIVTNSNTNGLGITGKGNGTAVGIYGEGGNTSGRGVTGAGKGVGEGVLGVADLTGAGVKGLGGSTSGDGVVGLANAGNSNGVSGTGAGTGAGVYGISGGTGPGVKGVGFAGAGPGLYGVGATGGGPGALLQGGGSGVGLDVTGGSSGGVAIAASRGDGGLSADVINAAGFINMSSGGNPAATVALSNRLTKKQIGKAWGRFSLTGSTSAGTNCLTSTAALNVATATVQGTYVNVTLASPVNANSTCLIPHLTLSATGAPGQTGVQWNSTTNFQLKLFEANGTAIDLTGADARFMTLSFHLHGEQ